jgi:polyhydroxybutyrate depolymerase
MKKIIIGLIIALVSMNVANSQNFRNRFRQQTNNNDSLEYIKVNNQTRSFMVENHESNRNKRPLVIMLHGGGGNAQNAKMMTDFSNKAKNDDFVIIYPNGSGRNEESLLTWNATHCCAFAMNNDVDDIAFLNAIIDHAISHYNVDANRIYLTGMSNGAMMTHKAAIALSPKIAAIATDVGTMFGDEARPQTGVPAMIINGLKDEMIPYNGGYSGGIRGAWDNTPLQPVLYQSEFWAKANNCKNIPQIIETNLIITYKYACPNNNNVTQIIVKQGNHAWYGGKAGRRKAQQPDNSINATDIIWDFFKSHHK